MAIGVDFGFVALESAKVPARERTMKSAIAFRIALPASVPMIAAFRWPPTPARAASRTPPPRTRVRRECRYRSVAIKEALDQINENMPSERPFQERSASDILTPDPAEVNKHIV
jgi:hypothetical protein